MSIYIEPFIKVPCSSVTLSAASVDLMDFNLPFR